MILPQSFLVSNDLDIFERDWSVILWNVSQFEFVQCFLITGVMLCIFDKNSIKMMLCPHHIKGLMMSICLITSDVYLDHLANLVSTRFLHHKWNYIPYFSDWHFSLNIKFLRFINIVACIIYSFSLLQSIPFCDYITTFLYL